MSYLGNSPGLVTQRLVNTFTATASQTTFTTTSTYVVGYVDVYVNGVKLNTADFVASSGSTVVLAEPCVSGDIVDILLYFPRALTDGYTKPEADTRFQPLDGPLVVSANTTGNALRITQTGIGNALLVEDSANPDATPFVIDASGNVVIGDTGLRTGPYGLQPIAQVSGATLNTSSGLFVDWQNNDTTGPALIFAKAKSGLRGTQGAVISGTRLFFQTFSGSDGTNFIPAAQIEAWVDGTPGTNDMPGRLVFSTTADGASSPTERMRITSAGNVLVGRTYTGNEKIGIGGPTNTYSTATSASSIFDDTTVSSAQTNAFTSFSTYISTQAASFTLANLTHYKASQFTIGAGSIVTNQYGFFVDSSLTGATNNYGFYSSIASGTGRYNFYANGTADNYFAGRVGIGATPESDTKVVVGGTLPSNASTSKAYAASFVVPSSTTVNTYGFLTYANTSATAFTLSNLYHYEANQGTIGAGSTVTSQYGFSANGSLTGATNNYGFYSNIASGTGRWNFYAGGTANNYFAGNVGIGLAPVANNGILQLGSYAAIKALIETATVSATAATGTINYDAATQAVLYYTSNATANWTLNLRGSSTLSLNTMMATGQSLTVAFLVQQGGTAYYPTALQVDGTSITPKWQGGTAPTSGNTNSIDVYTYTVIKTANATYTALASQTKFA